MGNQLSLLRTVGECVGVGLLSGLVTAYVKQSRSVRDCAWRQEFEKRKRDEVHLEERRRLEKENGELKRMLEEKCLRIETTVARVERSLLEEGSFGSAEERSQSDDGAKVFEKVDLVSSEEVSMSKSTTDRGVQCSVEEPDMTLDEFSMECDVVNEKEDSGIESPSPSRLPDIELFANSLAQQSLDGAFSEFQSSRSPLAEQFGFLEHEVSDLKEYIGACEQQLMSGKEELCRERSRSELLLRELKIQKDLLTLQIQQVVDDALEAECEHQQTRNEMNVQRETFQKTLNTLKDALEAKEVEIQERAEANITLRKDVLRLMAQFGKEKELLETRFVENDRHINELQISLDEVLSKKEQLEHNFRRAKKIIGKKNRKIQHVTKQLDFIRREFNALGPQDLRVIKVNKILKHIDCID